MSRRNETAVSNEQLIASLLQHGTIREAAQAAGISTRALYDRMRDDTDFRAEYAAAKNDIVRGAVIRMNESLSAAVTAITEIMNDTDVNPQTRLQAAQTILNSAGKFADRLTRDEREARNIGKDIFDSMMEL